MPDDTTFRVTGDGHGGQPFGCQPFSHQPPEPGCQLPMAEGPTPELPMPVPVTRHHFFLTLPILNTPYSILSYPTFAQELRSDLHLCTASLPSCPHVNLSTCQLVVVWPTGPLINRSTSVCLSPLHFCTFAPVSPLNASRPLDPSSHPTGDRGWACAHLGRSGSR